MVASDEENSEEENISLNFDATDNNISSENNSKILNSYEETEEENINSENFNIGATSFVKEVLPLSDEKISSEEVLNDKSSDIKITNKEAKEEAININIENSLEEISENKNSNNIESYKNLKLNAENSLEEKNIFKDKISEKKLSQEEKFKICREFEKENKDYICFIPDDEADKAEDLENSNKNQYRLFDDFTLQKNDSFKNCSENLKETSREATQETESSINISEKREDKIEDFSKNVEEILENLNKENSSFDINQEKNPDDENITNNFQENSSDDFNEIDKNNKNDESKKSDEKIVEENSEIKEFFSEPENVQFNIDEMEESRNEAIEFEETCPAEIIEKSEEENPESKTEEAHISKIININYDDSMRIFETALEIRYSSLSLSTFPIKISNVPKDMVFTNEITIGNTVLKIGDEVINNCYLKISSNDSVKLLEIKHREFKLGISVALEEDTITSYGDVHYYEVSSLIKYTRMTKVLKLLEKIFAGAVISFKVNKLYGNIKYDDRIEIIRIKTILNLFELLDGVKYKVQPEKIMNKENIYYLLNLEALLKENLPVETWCNFDLKGIKAFEGDRLIIKRLYKTDEKYLIEETITINDALNKNEIIDDLSVKVRRKRCTIQLKKINS